MKLFEEVYFYIIFYLNLLFIEEVVIIYQNYSCEEVLNGLVFIFVSYVYKQIEVLGLYKFFYSVIKSIYKI